MSIENLVPFAGTHAIQNVSLILEWQGDLSDQTLLLIHNAGSVLREHFPSAEIQKLVQINFGTTGVPVSDATGVGGISFQRMSQFGTVAKQLVVSRQNCVFAINDYVRWNAALEDVMRSYEVILPIILANRAINNIGLQYTDVFTWKDDPSALDIAEVFKRDSGLLPTNALQIHTLWHSHHGYFSDSSDPMPNNLLQNVNINVNDVSGERQINIVMSHQATLKSPIRRGTENYAGLIKDFQDSLHKTHKDMLARLLTDQVCSLIKLNLPEER
jgi:uncharacterized protein (TIGR04255 family)